MIEEPIRYIKEFADCGADLITFHYEAAEGKVQETIDAIKMLKSPCIILTDSEEEFAGMEVFRFPLPKYFWMAPLYEHLPLDMIAGYIAKLKGVKEFRADMEKYNSIGDQRNSEIVVL